MGSAFSRLNTTVVKSSEEKDAIVKCVPVSTFVPFPSHRLKPTGSLILEFVALPKKCYAVPEPVGMYWWTDAQFLPHRDSTLFVTTGAFHPRTNHGWVKAKRIPCGRIIRFDLDYERLRGEVFRLTMMSNYPKIHTHPSGQYIGYVGCQGVQVETITHDEVYLKHKDLRFCNYKYCSFSPDGKQFAILLSANRRFELLISRLDKGFSMSDKATDLSVLFPEFKGSTAYNEHLECKWSPDSQHIAVSSSIGFLVVLDLELNPVVNVFEDILPDLAPSCAGTFDYDPSSSHQVLVVGTNDRCVYIVNTATKSVLSESDCLSTSSIDCISYTPNGMSILVAFRDYSLVLCDSKSLEVTFKLDMLVEGGEIPAPPGGAFPGVIRVSFSSTGEQLAVSTCDGKVRLWQMPVNISLGELCRRAVLCGVPIPDLKHLPLPKRMITDFLSFPSGE